MPQYTFCNGTSILIGKYVIIVIYTVLEQNGYLFSGIYIYVAMSL